jgi:hypothetical protein
MYYLARKGLCNYFIICSNTGSFLLLESGKCNISRFPITPITITSPVTIGNREEQYIESLRKTEKVENYILIGSGKKGRYWGSESGELKFFLQSSIASLQKGVLNHTTSGQI